MSHEEYGQMLAKQNHCCALCESQAGGKQLAVDHDHDSKKVRGLLCQNCNTGLGKLQDNPELLRRAAKYIEDHRMGTDASATAMQPDQASGRTRTSSPTRTQA